VTVEEIHRSLVSRWSRISPQFIVPRSDIIDNDKAASIAAEDLVESVKPLTDCDGVLKISALLDMIDIKHQRQSRI
jgi:hypothetical protein